MKMRRIVYLVIFLAFQACVLTDANAQEPTLSFSWRSIAAGDDPNLPVHGSFASTTILGGEGSFTSIEGLPITSSIAGNDLNFFFAHNTLGLPALNLGGFGPQGDSGNVILQEFVASPNSFFHLMDGNEIVAVGQLLEVVVATPPSLISSGFGRLQLSSSGNGNPAIFNEILAATGGTGILNFSLAEFAFAGQSSTFPGAEFSSSGCLTTAARDGVSPTAPLQPAQINGAVSEFNIPDVSSDCFTYFSPNNSEAFTGFDFCALGNSFRSVILPDVGNGIYDLFLSNGNSFVFESQVTAGELFVFSGGPQKFRVQVAGVANPTTFAPAISFTGGGGSLQAELITNLEPLRILGTQVADNILVSQQGNQLEVNVNGNLSVHDLQTVSRLEIFGFGGRDVIEVAAAVPTFISGGFGPDEIRGGSLENEIQGGPGPDVIYGGPLADNINAGRGQDTVFALGGDDIILGGDAADTLLGGGGNDEITGGLGADELNGGPGNDNLLGNTGADMLIGGGGNDFLGGQGGPDELFGGPGNDELQGGEGFDLLDGGSGTDEALDQGENETSIEI